MNALRSLTLVLLSSICFSPALSAAAEGRHHTIEIVTDYDNLRLYFEPKLLHIAPGDTVTWVNLAKEDHNVVTYPDGFPDGAAAFESPVLRSAGEQWSLRFTVEGTYEYHCMPHRPIGMHGVIMVGRPSASGEFHKPSAAEVKQYRRNYLQWFDEDDSIYEPREQRHQATDRGDQD